MNYRDAEIRGRGKSEREEVSEAIAMESAASPRSSGQDIETFDCCGRFDAEIRRNSFERRFLATAYGHARVISEDTVSRCAVSQIFQQRA